MIRRKENRISEPPMAVSTQSTALNETGSWRYAKPIFLERTAPCSEACPAGEDIDRVMLLNSREQFIDAYWKIREENPFPGICGRVCLHPCEKACNRGSFDEAVSIRGLERFVSDRARERDCSSETSSRESGKRMAVVGSGPAGLSCAYFLALFGHRVTLFEKEKVPGGMLRWAIPEYRLPRDVLTWEIEQILSARIDFQGNTRVGRDVSFRDLGHFDAAFLAPGASRNELVPGTEETLKGVYNALEFLRQVREGSPPMLSGKVAVVGGGNTAIDAARTALRLGAQPTVLYRRSTEEMPAAREEVARAEREGVAFRFLTGISGVVEEYGRLRAVSCFRTKLGRVDETGRRTFVLLKSPLFEIKADYLILAAGQRPDLSFLPSRMKTERGLIIADRRLKTPAQRLFAGGDAVDQSRTVVHAIASGKRAAIVIDLQVKKESLDTLDRASVGNGDSLSAEAYGDRPDLSPGRRMKEVVSYEMLNLYNFRRSPRSLLPALDAAEAVRSFKEVEGGFTRRKAVEAARRCFNCGTCSFCSNCYHFCPDLAIRIDDRKMQREIDYDHCKGCGICVEECPRASVGMVQE